jgi:hypothetical protein
MAAFVENGALLFGARCVRAMTACVAQSATMIIKSLREIGFTRSADFPRFPCRGSPRCRSHLAPSASDVKPAFSTAEIWTNTSLPPPPSGWMKP